MTTSNAAGPPSSPFAREAASGASGRVDQVRALPPATGRVAAASRFATLLELLAKERAGRMPPAISESRGEGLGAAEGGAAGGANARIGARDARGDLGEEGDARFSGSDDVAAGPGATVDPMVPILVALAPRWSAASAPVRPEPSVPAEARTATEQLMAKLVRRIAWSGNARAGLARLELGAGELEGATLTIHVDDGVVRVALDLPPGVDRAAWKERISGRLGARGLQVEAVDVA